MESIEGNIVDIIAGTIRPGIVRIDGGIITNITYNSGSYPTFILPGLIDAHVHIESSMLVPSEFARLATVHGTVATVSDPHEIGNVLGVEGVEYMIDNGATVPFKFFFGAPSCVPATVFETAGAEIDPTQVERLLDRPEILYLSEMMNYPGAIGRDPMVMAKIAAALARSKPVDGHAPGLRGPDLASYVGAGISTDHESFQLDEALEKIGLGMKILIREGSAARNFEALHTLIDRYPEQCMLCSDDKHPDALVLGHIDQLVRRAFDRGLDRMNVLRAACINPVEHYHLPVGLLRRGDPADFIEVESLERFRVLRTVIDGKLVAERGRPLIERVAARPVNRFSTSPKSPEQFLVRARGSRLKVIEAIDGQLVTNKAVVEPRVVDGCVVSDIERDILKIVVVNRYNDALPAIGFVKGFGLKHGAIASSVAHDSHNIIAVGADDEDIASAVNAIIDQRGGLSLSVDGVADLVALPVAGLMSADDGYLVAERYSTLDSAARGLGATLGSPYMTLSFMALLVIPSLKLSDLGLFDGGIFSFVELME